MPAATFEIGKTFTFNTRAPSVLGSIIKNAKLTSILDYDDAIKLDNIDLKFRTIYPLLPANTPPVPEATVVAEPYTPIPEPLDDDPEPPTGPPAPTPLPENTATLDDAFVAVP